MTEPDKDPGAPAEGQQEPAQATQIESPAANQQESPQVTQQEPLPENQQETAQATQQEPLPENQQEPAQEDATDAPQEAAPALEKAYVLPDPAASRDPLPELAKGVDPDRVVFARFSVMVARQPLSNPRISGRPPDIYLYGDEYEVFSLMGKCIQSTLDAFHESENPDTQARQAGPSLQEIPHVDTAPAEGNQLDVDVTSDQETPLPEESQDIAEQTPGQDQQVEHTPVAESNALNESRPEEEDRLDDHPE